MRKFVLSSWVLIVAISTWGATPRAKLLSELPLRFEQSSKHGARYVAHTGSFDLELNPTESTIRTRANVVTAKLQHANAHAPMEALDRLPGTANYLLGSHQNWRTEVSGFARVRSIGVYPGIDLVFHGENGTLEYDFLVGPNSDPRSIRFALRGQKRLKIEPNGDLTISANDQDIRWHQPVVYQELNGVHRAIEGRFAIHGSQVAFEIGDYDRSRMLIIDPALAYVTYLGGANNEVGRGIGVDGSGNVYIAGVTGSAGLPTTSAAQANFGGSAAINPFGDAFVAKFSPTGTLLYLTYLGGSGNDAALALAVDAAGNAYIAGCTTSSTDFPLKNPAQAKFGGMGSASIVLTGDAFVAKLNPAGNQLLYSTYLGGKMDDIATSIAIDSVGNAYVAGATVSPDFPTSTSAYQRNMKGAGGEPIRPNAGQPAWEPGDAFVVKLNAAEQMAGGTLFGGSLDDAALSVAVDTSGNIYIGGSTLSSDLQTTSGAMQRSFGGVDLQNYFFNTGDGFIAEFDPTLTTLVYSTFFGGVGDDTVAAMVVDGSGNIYFTGSTSTPNLKASAGAFQPRYAGYYTLPFEIEQLYGDAYVAKINPSQTAPLYLSYLGGSQNDGGTAIAVDNQGNAYVTGFTDSGSDFPKAGTPLQSSFGGDGGQGVYILYGDAFLAVVNPTGTQLLYSSFYGGNADDEGDAIAIDQNGNVYVTGNTLSSNLQPPTGAFQRGFGGVGGDYGLIAARGDAFYVKFSGFANTGGGGGNTPILTLSSTTASFNYTIGGTAPGPIVISVSNTGAGTLQWFATSSNPSLFTVAASGASAAGGSSPLTINAIIPSNPTPGTYPATITVTASGATNSPQTISVSLVVNSSSGSNPVLTLSTTQASFNYSIGSTPPAPDPITISNTGSGVMNWNATSSNPSLFSVTPSGLSTPGAPSTLTITANIAGNLSPSTYSGTVTVTADGATNSPQIINVSLLVRLGSKCGSGTGAVMPGLTHFAAQDVWTFGIFVINTGSTPANFSAAFCDDNGNAVGLPFASGNSTKLSQTIPAMGSAYFETLNPPGAPLLSGWAQITADPTITVQALFRENASGTYYEAAVPSNAGATEFEIPFDATTFAATGDPFYTGFAAANLDPSNSDTLTCTARNQAGVAIPNAFAGSGPPVLPPLGHWAGYQFPALTGQRGTIDCVGTTMTAALALRFIGNSAFSSLPVINNPRQQSSGNSAISHFAAQNVWTSGFFLINTQSFQQYYSIGFFNDLGNSQPVPFAAASTTSTLSGSLPGYGSAYFETANAPGQPLISGWGQITAGNGVIVQALFRENSNGTYYEAAVPSSTPLTEFVIPFDNTTFAPTGDQLYTGFAIANLSADSTASIVCTARDQNGLVISGGFLGTFSVPQLGPMQHWAGYQFPALLGKRGTIDCISSAQIAATALRVIGNKTLSTLPVIQK